MHSNLKSQFSIPLSGGTFALYSLLCRHAKLSLLPNQQAADEELSAYKYGPSSQLVASSSPFKTFLDKHKRLRTALLVVVLFGACMVIGDGVLTPAISGNLTTDYIENHQSFWTYASLHIQDTHFLSIICLSHANCNPVIIHL